MNYKFFFEIIRKIDLLKTLYYSIRFKGKVIVGKRTSLNLKKGARIEFSTDKSSLYLGVHFSALEGTVLDMYENSKLIVGKSVGIHRGTKVVVRNNAVLEIGDKTFINENSRIQCAEKIEIGASTSIGWNCNILDTDLHGIYVGSELTNPNKPVAIGSNVWICANSKVLKNTIIKDNVIVGMDSIVSGKELESDYIYVGSPLRKTKKFGSWGVV